MKNILLLMVILALSLLVNCDNFKSKELSPEKKLELAEKCSKAGKEFFDQYTKNNYDPQNRWDEPEYHYNSRLNTCLIHIRFITLTDKTAYTFQYNQVIDIFSNKPILYGWFDRDVEKNTESLLGTMQKEVPNYTSTEYFKQKNKLFSE